MIAPLHTPERWPWTQFKKLAMVTQELQCPWRQLHTIFFNAT
jgi:hypothetical protein